MHTAGLVVVVHHSIRPSGRLFEWCDVRLPARRRVACASRETAQVGPVDVHQTRACSHMYQKQFLDIDLLANNGNAYHINLLLTD